MLNWINVGCWSLKIRGTLHLPALGTGLDHRLNVAVCECTTPLTPLGVLIGVRYVVADKEIIVPVVVVHLIVSSKINRGSLPTNEPHWTSSKVPTRPGNAINFLIVVGRVSGNRSNGMTFQVKHQQRTTPNGFRGSFRAQCDLRKSQSNSEERHMRARSKSYV